MSTRKGGLIGSGFALTKSRQPDQGLDSFDCPAGSCHLPDLSENIKDAQEHGRNGINEYYRRETIIMVLALMALSLVFSH